MGVDLLVVGHGPLGECHHQRHQGPAQLGHVVLDPGRHLGVGGARDQAVFGRAYLVAGGLKVVRPRGQLVASGNFEWMRDSSDAGVKAVGLVEILGAVGVVLP